MNDHSSSFAFRLVYNPRFDHRIYSWIGATRRARHSCCTERVAAPAELKQNPSRPCRRPRKSKSKIQNPKSKIHARGRPTRVREQNLFATFGFWILDSGLWILPFAFCSAGIRRRNRRRSRGSQRLIEDPRSVHSVTPEAESQEGGQALRILQQEFSAPSGNLGKILQNPTPKIPESQGGRITAALEFCLEGLAEQKSSWTNFDFSKLGR